MIFEELKPKKNQTISDASDLILYTSATTKDDASALADYVVGKTKADSIPHDVSTFITANEIYNIPQGAEQNSKNLNWAGAISELQDAYRLNQNTKQHFRHFVVSLAEGEQLTKSQWKHVSHTLMNELGYGNAKYIVFQHNDTDSQHCHYATSVVNTLDRKIINHWQNHTKAQTVMRYFEQRFGLAKVESSCEKNRRYDNKINNANKHSLKHMMRRKIETAIASLTSKPVSLQAFELALLKQGITITLKKSPDNQRFTGVTYHYSSFSFTGSSLKSGNKFSLGGLVKNMILTPSSLAVSNYRALANKEIERFETIRKLSEQHLVNLEEIAAKRKKYAKDSEAEFFNAIAIFNYNRKALVALENDRLLQDYLARRKRKRMSFTAKAHQQLTFELEYTLTKNSKVSLRLLYAVLLTISELLIRTGTQGNFELFNESFDVEDQQIATDVDATMAFSQ
ncbi:TPA: relaxase/mobilization nuclease domain-containing protein [Vibrio parahaemolyticus]|nr:relaxase/mobilization nuclease domain-containing protein [Vibrio parahaemolyticus]HCG7284490.1 relaxase/mobilization nuclease domain-containing protein [Vibrio parahaemolyticus]